MTVAAAESRHLQLEANPVQDLNIGNCSHVFILLAYDQKNRKLLAPTMQTSKDEIKWEHLQKSEEFKVILIASVTQVSSTPSVGSWDERDS